LFHLYQIKVSDDCLSQMIVAQVHWFSVSDCMVIVCERVKRSAVQDRRQIGYHWTLLVCRQTSNRFLDPTRSIGAECETRPVSDSFQSSFTTVLLGARALARRNAFPQSARLPGRYSWSSLYPLSFIFAQNSS